MTSTHSLTNVLKADSHGRVRTPADQREALLELYDQSSMSGATFARLHGLRYSTFMAWLRRRRLVEPPPPDSPLFQEVVVSPAPSCDVGVVAELPLGVRVRLERADQIPVLVALSRHLHEAARC